jgi:hypothetical protein
MKRDSLLDEAVAALRDESVDSATLDAALARVGRRLEASAPPADETGDDSHRIRGCEGFRALLPAHRAGALTAERRLLLEDHLRECVPCRRARRELDRAGAAPAAPAPVRHAVGGRSWRLAAALAGVAVGGAALWLALGGGIASPTAEVRVIEGDLLAFDAGVARPLAAGAIFGEGLAVRTGAASRAVLVLEDGSRVEMAPRSEVSLDRRRDGVVVALGRGNVIVEAAEQRRGHLYVRTDDCLVSVVGTIFSVAHGTRGSRVSVLDGEVRVDHGAELAVLRPGDQVATSDRLDRVPLAAEVAWSRNAAAYHDRIAALAEVGRQLDRALAVPAERTSTRLLDLAPAGTTIYAALPDVSGQLAEAWNELERRAGENRALAAWWGEHDSTELAAGIERLRAFGGYLGDELVVAVTSGESDAAPVMLAAIDDERGLVAAIEAELTRLAAAGQKEVGVELVDDPAAAVAGGDVLLVWPSPEGVLVATPSAARLREVAATLAGAPSAFVGTPFHRRLAEVYGRGAGWLLAFDAGTLLAGQAPAPDDAAPLAASGFGDLDHVVLESHTAAGATENHALVAFRDERTGIASWLAAPGTSGALEFVSPQAAAAAAGLLKDPAAMFDDLLALAGAGDAGAAAHFAEVEAELGVSLREDLAAALGGDFAVALDGPWLPKPSWKVVLEVRDPGRLTHGLDRLTEAWNRAAAEAGKGTLAWREEAAAGRVYRTLATAGGVDLLHLTFEDGFLLAGPSRALLAESIDRRAAGATLAASSAFLDLLPSGAETDFSAVAWQNLAASAGELGKLLDAAGGMPAGERDRLAALAGELGPMLAVASAAGDQVTLATRGGRGPLGLSLGSLFALVGLASEAEGPAAPPVAPEAGEVAAAAAATSPRRAA